MDYLKEIEEYLTLEIEVLKNINKSSLNEFINLLVETQKKHKRIYIFGNGGSAATASHFQNDFNKGISEYVDDKFRFQCLNDNIATVMAIANDIGYEEVFRFQLKNNLEKDDIVVAISGSGNSRHVINAVEYAKSCGNKIVGITGYDGGKLAKLSDINLNVPIKSMQITEDVHMIFDHLCMSVLYKYLCNKSHLS